MADVTTGGARKVRRTRGRKWMVTRAKVLQSNPLCVACQAKGRVEAATEIDHIKPLFKGGTDALDNLQGLCGTCHADKSAQESGKRRTTAFGVDGWPLEG